jgi:hypothetical protein
MDAAHPHQCNVRECSRAGTILAGWTPCTDDYRWFCEAHASNRYRGIEPTMHFSHVSQRATFCCPNHGTTRVEMWCDVHGIRFVCPECEKTAARPAW